MAESLTSVCLRARNGVAIPRRVRCLRCAGDNYWGRGGGSACCWYQPPRDNNPQPPTLLISPPPPPFQTGPRAVLHKHKMRGYFWVHSVHVFLKVKMLKLLFNMASLLRASSILEELFNLRELYVLSGTLWLSRISLTIKELFDYQEALWL